MYFGKRENPTERLYIKKASISYGSLLKKRGEADARVCLT